MSFSKNTGLIRGYITKIKKEEVGNNLTIYRLIIKNDREKEFEVATFDFDKLKEQCFQNFNAKTDEVIVEYNIRINKYEKEGKVSYYTSLMLLNLVVIKSSYSYVYEGNYNKQNGVVTI